MEIDPMPRTLDKALRDFHALVRTRPEVRPRSAAIACSMLKDGRVLLAADGTVRIHVNLNEAHPRGFYLPTATACSCKKSEDVCAHQLAREFRLAHRATWGPPPPDRLDRPDAEPPSSPSSLPREDFVIPPPEPEDENLLILVSMIRQLRQEVAVIHQMLAKLVG